jgi:dipeptidyl aminopeptidase/acylaminoacyl peptidase
MDHLRRPPVPVTWAAAVAAVSILSFGQGTRADYERSFGLAERIRQSGYVAPGPATAIGTSSRFWYRRGSEFQLIDAVAGTVSPAFDHARMASALATASGTEIKPDRLPFASITFTEDQKSVEVVVAEVRYRVNLETYAPVRVNAQRGDQRYPRSLPGPRVAESDRPLTSFDGKTVAFIRNFNVWVRPTKGKAATDAVPLSFDGSEGNYYTLAGDGPATSWSPDSTKLAVFRVRPGQRRKIGYIESSPTDQVQPKLSTVEYAKPGDTLDVPQAVLFDVASRKQTVVDNDLYPNPYNVSRIAWRRDSRAFTFEYNQRGHQVYRVIEVDAATGKPRALINEEVPASSFFCYYSKRFVHHVNDGRELVWMSERDGWNHLYLYDGATGKVKNQITKGPWVVRSVAKVDDKARQIWFSASGMHAGADPYYLHWFRVNFDGTGLAPITSNPDVTHTLAFTSDMQFFTDTWSNYRTPPVIELRRTKDLSLVANIDKGDPSKLAPLGWTPPEPFTAKARDGKTDIWGLIFRPSNFDATKKYPVLEYIYAGPHDSFVPKTFSAGNPMQAMAELGFVVVQMDGMGTSNRSKAFHDYCWKNIGDAGFPDRILWHKAAAAKYPWYDVARLGIYGHSAGGQNSLGALLFHGDFYKAAASSAGCHDNRMDKISWNEQWMGWPVGPEYSASSNVDHANKLKGKLLLAVGEMDTNVDPASTMQVVNALIKANKMFDLLVLPGQNHGGWGDYWDRKRADFFVRELLGVAPPDWNTSPASATSGS